MIENTAETEDARDTERVDPRLQADIERYLEQLQTVTGCRRVLAEVLAKAAAGIYTERMAGILRGMVDSASRLIEAESRTGGDGRSSHAIATLAEANARARRKAARMRRSGPGSQRQA